MLDHQNILRLRGAVITANLAERRDVLLAGINKNFVASLATAKVPGDQVLHDLDALNTTGILEDQSNPFAIWLLNAIAAVGDRGEIVVFRDALRNVQPPTTSEAGSHSPLDSSAALVRSPQDNRVGGRNQITLILSSPSDKKVVKPLVELLRASGQQIFFAPEDLDYGDNAAGRVREVIRRSARILVFWSRSMSHDVDGPHMTIARRCAECIVVPIKLDDTPLPEELAQFHANDAVAALLSSVVQTRLPGRLAAQVMGLFVAVAVIFILYLETSLPIVADGPPELDSNGDVIVVAVVGLGILLCSATLLAYRKFSQKAKYRNAAHILSLPDVGAVKEAQIDPNTPEYDSLSGNPNA